MKKIIQVCMILLSFYIMDTHALSFSKKVISDPSFNQYVSVQLDQAINMATITPVKPIRHLDDINLETKQGIELATAIVHAAVYVAKRENNADFKMRIICNKNNVQIKVELYKHSSYFDDNSECHFCDKQYFKGPIIAENDTTIAFEKSNPPRNPINFVIISREHVVNYKDSNFTPGIFIEQLKMAQKLSQKLVDSIFELIINNGTNAGQAVSHSHMHFCSLSKWKL